MLFKNWKRVFEYAYQTSPVYQKKKTLEIQQKKIQTLETNQEEINR